MKQELIVERKREVEEISEIVSRALTDARNEVFAASGEVRLANSIESAAGAIRESLGSVVDESMREGLQRVESLLRSELQRSKDRLSSASERERVLRSFVDFLGARRDVYEGKLKAIERVLEGESNRPEKLSVIREAEGIRRIGESAT